jgi:c-di-GMP-related signal transduction protein
MQAFIARQPIFDAHQKVHAYELLFRSGQQNAFNHFDPDQATYKVIADSQLLHGMGNLTGGKQAFINITTEVLVKDYCSMLPKEQFVIEILENIEPTDEVITATKKLKEAGYVIALDDFVYDEKFKPLIELADIIKVDFLNTNVEKRKELVDQFAPLGISMLAEKVETREEFEQAVKMGYSYFQGYFFSKPVIVSNKDIPGSKLQYLRILQEINSPDIDLIKVEEIIKHDMSLSYKLLRYINSAIFGLRNDAKSIKQALSLMGEKETKKWASLLALANMGHDKPEELVAQALIRAKFAESLAKKVNLARRADDLFLMGMLSLIDAILDRNLAEILAELPISKDIKEALLGEENQFRSVYDYILAYECGDWQKALDNATKLSIVDEDIPSIYLKSVDWVQQSFQSGAL